MSPAADASGGVPAPLGDPAEFVASLTDTSLYSIGAYFADRHPDLVDDVVAGPSRPTRAAVPRPGRADGGAPKA